MSTAFEGRPGGLYSLRSPSPASRVSALRVTIPDAKARSPIARCGRSGQSLCPPSLPGSPQAQGQAPAGSLREPCTWRLSLPLLACSDRPTDEQTVSLLAAHAEQKGGRAARSARRASYGSSLPLSKHALSACFFCDQKNNRKITKGVVLLSR